MENESAWYLKVWFDLDMYFLYVCVRAMAQGLKELKWLHNSTPWVFDTLSWLALNQKNGERLRKEQMYFFFSLPAHYFSDSILERKTCFDYIYKFIESSWNVERHFLFEKYLLGPVLANLGSQMKGMPSNTREQREPRRFSLLCTPNSSFREWPLGTSEAMRIFFWYLSL